MKHQHADRLGLTLTDGLLPSRHGSSPRLVRTSVIRHLQMSAKSAYAP